MYHHDLDYLADTLVAALATARLHLDRFADCARVYCAWLLVELDGQLHATLDSDLFYGSSTLLLALSAATIASVLLLLLFRMLFSPSSAPVQPAELGQGLLQFVVPVGSIWPPRYSRAVNRHGSASIGFGALIRDLVDGVVELRSPHDARLLVLCSTFCLGTCTVDLKMETRMWTSAMWFLVKNELPLLSSADTRTLISFPEQDHYRGYTERPGSLGYTICKRSSSPIQHHPTLLGSLSVFSLDAVPRPHIDRALDDISRYVGANGSALLYLTSPTATRPPLLSKRGVVMCMLLTHSTPPFQMSATCSTSALYAALGDIISILTRRAQTVAVEYIRDVTCDHVASLRRCSDSTTTSHRRATVLNLMWAEMFELGWFARWEVRLERPLTPGRDI